MKSFFAFGIALVTVPLFPALILKTKAFFAGRKGPPLLIKYYTLDKLLQKGSVYSRSTTFVFRLGPTCSFAAALMALLFFPFAGQTALLSFQGDVIVLFYVLAMGRFFTIAAALDTASPFEGMGAAREAFFAILAEAGIFVLLILFYRMTGSLSLSDYFSGPQALSIAGPQGALLLLAVVALFMLLLVENSRVPVDDPATHLELTMIHEVMILDHSGPDLAFIELGAFCKLFFYAALVVALLFPFSHLDITLAMPLFYGLIAILYIFVGLVESITARLKMNMVPKFILTAFAIAFFAVILTLEFIR